jgi:hypothetical protein
MRKPCYGSAVEDVPGVDKCPRCCVWSYSKARATCCAAANALVLLTFMLRVKSSTECENRVLTLFSADDAVWLYWIRFEVVGQDTRRGSRKSVDLFKRFEYTRVETNPAIKIQPDC